MYNGGKNIMMFMACVDKNKKFIGFLKGRDRVDIKNKAKRIGYKVFGVACACKYRAYMEKRG